MSKAKATNRKSGAAVSSSELVRCPNPSCENGAVDTGGMTPWGAPISDKCGWCDGRGKTTNEQYEAMLRASNNAMNTCPKCGCELDETNPNCPGCLTELRSAQATCSAFPAEAVIEEHREMHQLLVRAVDAMRITQRLFDLKDGHILMSKCREIERWLDDHQ